MLYLSEHFWTVEMQRMESEVAVAELAAVLVELGFDVEPSTGLDAADLVLPGRILVDV